jgi:pantoate ligase/cytidylate kinase
LQDLEAAGVETTLEKVEADIQARDERDASRVIAPLAKAPGAVEVLTDGMSIDEVVQTIADLALAAGAQAS